MAESYLSRQFGHSIPIPVDVDLLAEKAEGVILDFYPGLRANHQIVGGVFRDIDTGELGIYIDEEVADDDSRSGWAFYRTTVAEELAHIHLHRGLIERVETADDFRKLHNHPNWHELERNAKRFAAAILMPAAALGPESAKAYEEIVGRPEVWATFHSEEGPARWMNPVKKWMCQALARRFEVSERSMHYRLGEWPPEIYKRVESSVDAGSDVLL
jgi:hypothetical protein